MKETPHHNESAQFVFTEEQQQFREYLRRFLSANSSTAAVRKFMASEAGFDADVWRRLHSELALPSLSIPPEFGGSGFGMIEVGIAMEEMGRALLPSPFFASSVVAAKTIEFAATEEQKAEFLPKMATGEMIATLAYMESADHAGELTCRADNSKLTGTKRYVLEGLAADLLLVVVPEPAGRAIYAVNTQQPGVKRRKLATIDETRRLAEVSFDNADGVRLGSGTNTEAALTKVFDIAYIALANECVGGAARLFEDTLDYTKLRRQFGRTIASFQAIKHRMAEFLLSVELAKSAAYYAAEAYDHEASNLTMLASLAKSAASDAYVRAATESIQLHGGIGFTWENNTHLWFKRAKGSEVLFGDPSYHRTRMVSELVEQEVA